MPFEKGNTASQGKRKPGGGRKAMLSTQVKRALNNVPVSDIFKTLQELAQKGDREACIYLLDRVLGKPTQKSVELQAQVDVSPKLLMDTYLGILDIERKQLTGGTEMTDTINPKEFQKRTKEAKRRYAEECEDRVTYHGEDASKTEVRDEVIGKESESTSRL